MLRITRQSKPTETRLQIEGRITEDTLGEIARLGETTLASSVLDLRGVTFVDQPSVRRLQEIRARGAVLDGCSPFVLELLERPRIAVRPTAARSGIAAAPAEIEDELLAGLRRGDEDAFAALVRREGGRMLATARRMLGCEQDAQDAVQEAFLQAHRAMSRFAGEARLSTWLHRIVVNAALMKLRTRRRKPEQALDDLLPRFDEHGEWLQPVTGWEHSSDEIVASAECRAIVRRAIERLPDAYREVLTLRDIEGFDTEETASMLETTTNAVKVRLHRARQALRTLLERDLGGAPVTL